MSSFVLVRQRPACTLLNSKNDGAAHRILPSLYTAPVFWQEWLVNVASPWKLKHEIRRGKEHWVGESGRVPEHGRERAI